MKRALVPIILAILSVVAVLVGVTFMVQAYNPLRPQLEVTLVSGPTCYNATDPLTVTFRIGPYTSAITGYVQVDWPDGAATGAQPQYEGQYLEFSRRITSLGDVRFMRIPYQTWVKDAAWPWRSCSHPVPALSIPPGACSSGGTPITFTVGPLWDSYETVRLLLSTGYLVDMPWRADGGSVSQAFGSYAVGQPVHAYQGSVELADSPVTIPACGTPTDTPTPTSTSTHTPTPTATNEMPTSTFTPTPTHTATSTPTYTPTSTPHRVNLPAILNDAPWSEIFIQETPDPNATEDPNGGS